MPKATLHRDLPELAAGFDAVFIDGPPRVGEFTRSAMLAADVVLIPVQPSPYDVWAAEEILAILREASAFKENLKTAFTVNRKIVNTAIGRDLGQALAQHSVPVLAAAVSQRVAFAESAAQGLVVMEVPGAEAAANEVRALAAELKGMMA